ncbi:Na+/H+ antiporter subunit E [Azotobacter chroococcum]|nr:Na+/H+ antiporter subunit E [Azotobacter chroococcum]
MFLGHLLLSGTLAALLGAFHFQGLLAAFVLLYLLCRLAVPVQPLRRHARRVELGSAFIVWFIGQVLLASLHVASLVLARQVRVEPAVVAVFLRRPEARLATLLGCLLSLTPGTMALEYRETEGILFIHALDARSPAAVEHLLRELERRLLHWLDAGGPG